MFEPTIQFFSIPISLWLGILMFGLIAKWSVIPKHDLAPREEALLPLLLLHAFRYIGLAFLVTGVVSADLPA